VLGDVCDDSDGDGVVDDVDFCPGSFAGALVNVNGCTARQLKAEAVESYKDLSLDLLQPGSEVGSGEVADVLVLLVTARTGIVQGSFLLREEPSEFKGVEVFESQQTAFEKLDGFEGKKIDDVLIEDIPSILARINALQAVLVEDSQILAQALLDNIDCSSLSGGSSAREECDKGLEYLFEGTFEPGVKGAERIDFFKKAWEQGVKVLEELGITGNVARRF